MASNCTSNCEDSVTTITQPTAGRETEDETFCVKVITITVINYDNNNNQYAELALFAEEEEDDGYEWDCTQVIIPKPLLLASNRTQT